MSWQTVQAVNESSGLSDSRVDEICRALSIQGTHHVAPAWGLEPVSVQRRHRTDGDWQLVFLDNSDQAEALGYHDTTPDGLPLMKVFVKTCQEYGVTASACASHELAEAMVDPDLLRVSYDEPHSRAWFLEVADPTQDFTYEIGGIEVQDFVYPAWFKPYITVADERRGLTHLRKITHPLTVPSGGYAQFTTDLRNWQHVGLDKYDGENRLEKVGHSRPERRRAAARSCT